MDKRNQPDRLPISGAEIVIHDTAIHGSSVAVISKCEGNRND